MTSPPWMAKHTVRGFDRLVNFTDAVVAIAITLLILPVIDLIGDAVPSMPPTAVEESSGFLSFWNASASNLLAFLFTFLLMCWFWWQHHRLFERLKDYSTPLLCLAFLWLLGMVFLAFPSGLVGEYAGTRDPASPHIEHHHFTSLFLLTMAWICLMTACIAFYARRHPQLLVSEAAGIGLKFQGTLNMIWCFWYLLIGVLAIRWGAQALFLTAGMFLPPVLLKRHARRT